MRNPPILIAVLGFFAALAGFGFLFLGLRLIGFDWFGLFGDLPALERVGLWGWLALATGIVWLLAGLGLWTLQPWARLFVMVMAGIALLEAAIATFQYPGAGLGLSMAVMPAIILWYLTTGEVKAAFAEALDRLGPDEDRATAPAARPMAAEAPSAAPAFAGAGASAGAGAVAVAATATVVDRPEAPVAPVVAAAVAAPAEAPAPVAAPAPAPAPAPEPATPMPVAAPGVASAATAELAGSARAIKVVDVEGIGAAYSDKLGAAGVSTTDDLLAAAATRSGRQHLAERTGISEHLILEWVNNADLLRIPGVGTQYSDLLEAAGVDSPAELAQRNAGNLATTFQELVAARPGTVRRIPTEAEVAQWIEAARNLPRVVEH